MHPARGFIKARVSDHHLHVKVCGMIELYHSMSARSFRPLWALEALGVEYKLHMLPFPPRYLAREFLEINPLGTVPALITEQGALMTESAAICEYLAQAYGPSTLAVRPDEKDFASYLNWLHHGETTLTFPQTIVLRYGKFEPAERQLEQAVEDYSRWFLSRLRAVEATLADRAYLCENRFTMADISVGYALMLAKFIGLGCDFSQAVNEYWGRLRIEPSFQKAWNVQEVSAIQQGVPTTHAPLGTP